MPPPLLTRPSDPDRNPSAAPAAPRRAGTDDFEAIDVQAPGGAESKS